MVEGAGAKEDLLSEFPKDKVPKMKLAPCSRPSQLIRKKYDLFLKKGAPLEIIVRPFLNRNYTIQGPSLPEPPLSLKRC